MIVMNEQTPTETEDHREKAGLSETSGARQKDKSGRVRIGRYYKRVSGIAKTARGLLDKFMHLQLLDSETKLVLLQPIRRHQIRIAAFSFDSAEAFVPVLYLTGPLFLVIMLGAPFIANKWWFDVRYNFLSWVGIYIFYWIAFCTSLLIALGPMSQSLGNVRHRRKGMLREMIRDLIWFLAVELIYTALFFRLLPETGTDRASILIQITVASLFANSLVLFYVILMVLSSILISSITDYRRNTLYPKAVIISTLIEVLERLESHPKDWEKANFKRVLMQHLEKIAVCIQRDIPRQLRSGDDSTDVWTVETANKMATAIRERKKWILIPKQDTREHLIKSLVVTLTLIASDNWDGLEKGNLEKTSPSAILLRVSTILKTLLTSLLPIFLFWFFQKTPLALKGTAADYILAGCIIWLVLTLLPLIDPDYKDKIKLAKEIFPF